MHAFCQVVQSQNDRFQIGRALTLVSGSSAGGPPGPAFSTHSAIVKPFLRLCTFYFQFSETPSPKPPQPYSEYFYVCPSFCFPFAQFPLTSGSKFSQTSNATPNLNSKNKANKKQLSAKDLRNIFSSNTKGANKTVQKTENKRCNTLLAERRTSSPMGFGLPNLLQHRGIDHTQS